MQEAHVRSLGWEDPLEKEMATHSSTLAWKIPWTKEPGRLQSMGSQRVRHNWATSLHFTTKKLRAKTRPLMAMPNSWVYTMKYDSWFRINHGQQNIGLVLSFLPWIASVALITFWVRFILFRMALGTWRYDFCPPLPPHTMHSFLCTL